LAPTGGAVPVLPGLVAELAALRPRPGSMVRYLTLLALRELGRRAHYLDGQLARLDELITPLVTARVPGLLTLFGAGPDTAVMQRGEGTAGSWRASRWMERGDS
jgi:hypothetical protein